MYLTRRRLLAFLAAVTVPLILYPEAGWTKPLLRSTRLGTGVGELSYTYLGLGVTASKYIILAKHASARYVFVDPVNGNDAWDGLAGAFVSGTNGPRRTMKSAWVNVCRYGFGDWLLVAKNTDASTSFKGTCSITNASPAVVTLTAHGLTSGTQITFTGTLPAPLVLGKSYYVIAAGLTTDTFEFSATFGGSAVNTTQSGTCTLNTCPDFNTRSRTGQSRSYPTLISTYDAADPTNTAKYNVDTDVFYYNTLDVEWTMNSLSGGAFRHDFTVIRNLRMLRPSKSVYGITPVGPGDGFLIENSVFNHCPFHVYTLQFLDSAQNDELTNFCLRRCGVWHGSTTGIFLEESVPLPIFESCVFHQGGYSGDLRSDAGQQVPPLITNHNIYSYGKNTRIQNTLLAFGSSFGATLRQGGDIYRNAFVHNANQLTIAGASTDTNHDFNPVDCNIIENVFSGAAYIDGTAPSTGGWGISLTMLSSLSTVNCRRNLLLNANSDVSSSAAIPFLVSAGGTTATYLARYKTLTLDTVSALTSSGVLTGQTSGETSTAIEVRGLTILAYDDPPHTPVAWQAGEVVKKGATTIGTIQSVANATVKVFNAEVANYSENIQRNWGNAAFSPGADTDGGHVGTVTRTLNVWSNEAASGNNVTYASVSGTYLDPTRDFETWAVYMGYASALDLCNYAVLHPEIDWAHDSNTWIMAGFNRVMT